MIKFFDALLWVVLWGGWFVFCWFLLDFDLLIGGA